MLETLPDLISRASARDPDATALRYKLASLNYGGLHETVIRCADGLQSLGIFRTDRVGIYLEKRIETVVALFGTTLAGGVFVPINPLLKGPQVEYIVRDCSIKMIVTTRSRFEQIAPFLSTCPSLKQCIIVDHDPETQLDTNTSLVPWADLLEMTPIIQRPRIISSDMAAIMYTSGSTGMPKGVVLSHSNLVIGAESVATYIGNTAGDRILSILPLSFDAGLSQVTTGFYSGACVVLHNHFLARDVVRIIGSEKISGLTGVPPLWMQLADQKWPEGSTDTIRYFANTGGKMPRATLERLMNVFPTAQPFLMYGLTESFRSTYLPPAEIESRPDSIGKAVPNVEVLVVAKDGSLCKPGEIGELVHRGPLVSLGYWNDRERTAERFRPAPAQPGELPHPELAVWSGDFVKMDNEGFLYFIGRKDDMIKTSGYRVSPSEVEEMVHDSGLVSEVAALGIPDEQLGQRLVLIAKARVEGEEPTEKVLAHVRSKAPNYMVPAAIYWREKLPRNANGKMDRRQMVEELAESNIEASN